MRAATAKPEANAMLMAGGVCPDQGMNEPQTMKTRKKEARHSATMERQKSSDRISACIGTRILLPFPASCCSKQAVSKRSSNVVIRFSRPALVSGVVATLIVAIVSHSHTRSKSIFTRCGNKTKARETQQQQQMGLCTLGK